LAQTIVFFFMVQQALVGQDLPIIEALQSHSDTPNSAGLLLTSDQTQTPPLKRDGYLYPGRDSNPQSQVANGR
jgi:hypothetical protein